MTNINMKSNTYSNWKAQLKPRAGYTLSQAQVSHSKLASHIFLCSPSDSGVIRNGGKSGARFAPQAILSQLSKMVQHPPISTWSSHNVSEAQSEIEDFQKAQNLSSTHIKEVLNQANTWKSLFHLGAGHDHVYPLVKALMSFHEKVKIINIDAHLDTREDPLAHSGTPFRQIHNEFGGKRVNISQVGIHQYANAQSNFQNLGDMDILAMEDIKKDRDLIQWLDKSLCFDQGPLIISLDCDALDGSIMPAVSAVNHQGLSKHHMDIILDKSLQYGHKYQWSPIFGIYEYNPLFDDLNTSSARYLSSLVHKVYKHSASK